MPNTIRRLRRLLLLDLGALDEAAADGASTPASIAVAVISMALLGLGGWLWWVLSDLPERGDVFMSGVIFATVFAVALWLVWLLVVFVVLQRLSGRAPRIEPLVRACGLAAAPLALGLLMAVPVVSFAVGLVAVAGWVLLTQTAIERSTGAAGAHALVANLAGFAVWAGVMSLLSTAHDQLAPGPFLAEALWDTVAAARDVVTPG